MKKVLLAGFALFSLLSRSQTYDQPWNAGIHGGATQYSGEWGTDFYHINQPFYGHVGLSVSRYLSRHFDATLFMTRGDLGHFQEKRFEGDPERNKFLMRLNTIQVLLKYNILSSDFRTRPYFFAGTGILMQRSMDNDIAGTGRGYDLAIPSAGIGVNYDLNDLFILQFQEMFIHTSADNMDYKTGGGNDSYLYHTIGITMNFGHRSCSKGGGGVGDRIDRCPDMPVKSKKR